MADDDAVPDPLAEMGRPEAEHEVAEIVSTTSGTSEPPPEPAPADLPEVSVSSDVALEAQAEEADAEEYLAGVAPSVPLDAVPAHVEAEQEAPGLFDDENPEIDDRPPRTHDVTAVLVAHDGT